MVRRSFWHSGAIFWHSKNSIDLKVSSVSLCRLGVTKSRFIRINGISELQYHKSLSVQQTLLKLSRDLQTEQKHNKRTTVLPRNLKAFKTQHLGFCFHQIFRNEPNIPGKSKVQTYFKHPKPWTLDSQKCLIFRNIRHF